MMSSDCLLCLFQGVWPLMIALPPNPSNNSSVNPFQGTPTSMGLQVRHISDLLALAVLEPSFYVSRQPLHDAFFYEILF